MVYPDLWVFFRGNSAPLSESGYARSRTKANVSITRIVQSLTEPNTAFCGSILTVSRVITALSGQKTKLRIAELSQHPRTFDICFALRTLNYGEQLSGTLFDRVHGSFWCSE